MRGARGLLLWCGLVVVAGAGLLLTRPTGDDGLKAAALACLGAVVGVLATRGFVRRLVCAVVGVLALIPITHGRAWLGVPLVALAMIGTASSGSWPAMGQRFEGPGAAPRPRATDDDMWGRIDRGDDPTE